MPEKNSLYEYRDCLFFNPSFYYYASKLSSYQWRVCAEMLKKFHGKRVAKRLYIGFCMPGLGTAARG